MSKINMEDVVKSFFVGIAVGLALSGFATGSADMVTRVLSVLAAGAIGLLIGFVTEAFTALLPIRIARTRTYFFINNLIAIVVTTAVMLALVALSGGASPTPLGWWPVIGVAVSIVSVANLIDFLMYRRAQQKLRALQDALASADDS